jgi:hypothetical protein
MDPRRKFRWPRRWRVLTSAVLLLSSTLLTGCCNTKVVDLPASDLDVTVTVSDTGLVSASLYFENGGQRVLPVGVIKLGSCQSESGEIGICVLWPSSPGQTIHVEFSRQNVTSAFDITVQVKPTIVAPAAGASVSVSQSLTVTYVAADGAHVEAKAYSQGHGGSAGSGYVSSGQQPDSGSCQLGNVSSLPAGSGSVEVDRSWLFAPADTGFHSVRVDYKAITSEHVTWVA